MPSPSRPAQKRAIRQRRLRLSPTMRCETAFRLIVSDCLEEVATNHAAVCDGNPVALHHTRIAFTRLKAAIAFYGRMVADPEWVRLKSELKWLSGYLGATRDLDVAIASCAGGPQADAFNAARADVFDQLKAALASERYRQWVEAMWGWTGSGPWTARQDQTAAERRALPVAEFHARRLKRWRDKLIRKSRGLQGMGKTKRHDVRLASKRLRYAVEFSEGGLTAEDQAHWQRVLKHLRKGQHILGELNDAEVQRVLLEHAFAQQMKTPKRAAKSARTQQRKRKTQLLRRAAAIYRKMRALSDEADTGSHEKRVKQDFRQQTLRAGALAMSASAALQDGRA